MQCGNVAGYCKKHYMEKKKKNIIWALSRANAAVVTRIPGWCNHNVVLHDTDQTDVVDHQ